jgi:hypothetical protein
MKYKKTCKGSKCRLDRINGKAKIVQFGFDLKNNPLEVCPISITEIEFANDFLLVAVLFYVLCHEWMNNTPIENLVFVKNNTMALSVFGFSTLNKGIHAGGLEKSWTSP